MRYQLKFYFFIFLLLVLQLFTGCGSEQTILPLPTMAPTVSGADLEVLSTVYELESKSSNFSAGQEGQMEFGDIKLEISPESLESDSKIEIAKVSIEVEDGKTYKGGKDGQADLYEISTGQIDKHLDLNKPVKVNLRIDPNAPDPGLAIWGGEEWISIDPNYINYDRNNNTLSTYIDYIEEDLNQSILDGTSKSEQSSPLVVTYFSNIRYYDLNYGYPNYTTSKNKHFTIHYAKNFTEEKARAMGDAFEYYYDYYTKTIGYTSPVNFLFSPDPNNDPNTVYRADCMMVYVAIDPNAGGWASNYGIIKMPATWEKFAAHELFHMIQHQYGKRAGLSTWIAENTATGIEGFMYNEYTGGTDKGKYDTKGDGVIWDEMEHFSYSLDSDLKAKDKIGREYKNGIIWAYFLKKYGLSVWKDIVAASFTNPVNNNVTLSYVNEKFNTYGKVSLANAYFDALEDFFIYGNLYNKTYFNNLPYRDPNEAMSSQYSGFSTYYNYKAFDPNGNIYTNTKTISLEHLSGKYFNFNSGGEKGSLNLSVYASNEKDVKVKVYSIKNKDGLSEIKDIKEYVNNDVDNISFLYNDNITDITVLMENTSFNEDKNVNFKATGVKSKE